MAVETEDKVRIGLAKHEITHSRAVVAAKGEITIIGNDLIKFL